MNIFFLDIHPQACAKYHCDKHVRKMMVEYAQILSTAHRILDGVKTKYDDKKYIYLLENENIDNLFCYKQCYINHPVNIWVRSSQYNYTWLYLLWNYLHDEYQYRFDKVHLSYEKCYDYVKKTPLNLRNVQPKYVKYPRCFGEYKYQIHEKDIIGAYRQYYKLAKSHILQYTRREKPKWLT